MERRPEWMRLEADWKPATPEEAEGTFMSGSNPWTMHACPIS